MEHGSSNGARRALSRGLRQSALGSWYRKIAKYYAGDVNQAELLAAADTRERQCEAYYYIAEKTRIERGCDEAEVWFRKCCEQEVRDYWEDRLARWRLSRR
jgi:lipoprotein NlpI